ncbi:hypothetical protein [Marinactinospora rubrisoli]|uniref:Uncharacterized protein n=1 Tax=Marinactinospora rubrisoli TaxID=2715399 RepID=A0ABW2KK42_9ACTN
MQYKENHEDVPVTAELTLTIGDMRKSYVFHEEGAVRKNASGTVKVDKRTFRWVEQKSGENRGFTLQENGVEGAEEVEYRATPSPITADEKWYHSNVTRWYEEAAQYVADTYVRNNNKWPSSKSGTIHKVSYSFRQR